MTNEQIDELVTAAGRVGLLWVGVPRQQMLVALFDIREALKTKLSPQLGADAADLASQAFVAAAVGVRDAIETTGGNVQHGAMQ
jgi:hypothetical protein